ncbi:MAG: hypothetical protein U0R17_02985 [Acidimicrobiia bacterium]
MGGGSWNIGTYDTSVSAKKAANAPTFGHDYDVRTGASNSVHELLDPKVLAGPTSPHAGKVMREVMITDEHPNPTPIGIVLDVTGSNYDAAVKTHGALPKLFSLLQVKGYVDDPQINVSATGDANSDRFPVQFGQFESDNRIDAQLEAMILEGAGGGQDHETYELLAYLHAFHTYLEPAQKQGRKGYLFFIGDEKPYDKVKRSQVEDLIGVKLEKDISTEDIFKKLKEQYNVFFLFQEQGSYLPDEILPSWRKLLGERAISLSDPDAVCDVIAGLVGVLEKKVTIDDVDKDLKELGSSSSARKAVSTALEVVDHSTSVEPNRPSKGGMVAKTSGSLPDLGVDLSRPRSARL